MRRRGPQRLPERARRLVAGCLSSPDRPDADVDIADLQAPTSLLEAPHSGAGRPAASPVREPGAVADFLPPMMPP